MSLYLLRGASASSSGVSKLLLRCGVSSQLRLVSSGSSILYSSAAKGPGSSDQTPDLEDSFKKAESELNRMKYEFNKSLPVSKPGSYFDKLKESLGLQGGLRHPQALLTIAGLRLYLCIQYQVNYDKLFQTCQMSDVMYSFCLITFLHVWLISIQLTQHGRTGLHVRRLLHQNMWKDIETRARKLKASMNRKNQLKTYNTLNGVFQAFLFGFDEGILSDDHVLASAVWRHLFEMKEIEDFEAVGKMCDYIRKNVAHLDKINELDLLRNGVVSFVDMEAQELDHMKVRAKILAELRKKEDE